MNLFDLNSELTNSHFLPLQVLGFAYGKRSNETSFGRGFILINKLIQEADDLFISKLAIEDTLKKLSKFGLIEFDNQSKEELETALYYKCTATGIYYLKILVKRFIYIDLIHQDTPISDYNICKKLRRQIDNIQLDERMNRCMLFLEYLENAEKKEHDEHPEYNSSDLTRFTYIPKIKEEFNIEIAKILEKPRVKSILLEK